MGTLTETSDWEDVITVPDDGDDADAASVEGVFRVLASRARHLLGRLVPVETALATPREYPHIVPLRAMPLVGNGGWMTDPDQDDVIFGHSGGSLYVDLARYASRGSFITEVRARVIPQARTGTARFSISLARQRSIQLAVIVDPRLTRTDVLATEYALADSSAEQDVVITPASPVGVSGAYVIVRASNPTPPAGDSLLVLTFRTTQTGL